MKLTIFQIVFLGVILALATFSWYWLYQILYFNQMGWGKVWLLPAFLFSFLISLILILWISGQYFLEIFLSIIFVLGSFFFIFPFQKNILIGIIVTFIFLIWASKKVKNERNQQLKISIKSILKNGIFWFLISFFMIISLAFHFSPKNNLKINLPLQYLDYLEPTLQKNIPGYRPSLTFEEIFLTYQVSQLNQSQQQAFLTTLAQSSDTLKFLKNEKINIQDLNPDTFSKILSDEKFFPIFKKILFQTNPEIKKIEKEFIGNYNIMENTINQNWKNFLQNNLNHRLAILPLNWQNYLKIALSSSLFLSLWALTFLFSPLIIFFSWLIFKLLLGTKLIEIKTEPAEKEIITTK